MQGGAKKPTHNLRPGRGKNKASPASSAGALSPKAQAGKITRERSPIQEDIAMARDKYKPEEYEEVYLSQFKFDAEKLRSLLQHLRAVSSKPREEVANLLTDRDWTYLLLHSNLNMVKAEVFNLVIQKPYVLSKMTAFLHGRFMGQKSYSCIARVENALS